MFDAAPTPWVTSKLRMADPVYTLANMDAIIRCLKPAVERSKGEWRVGDIIALILQGSMQLWTSERDGEVEAVCVTQLLFWPNMKALNFVFIGGKRAGNWIAMDDEMAEWARSQGCTELRGVFDMDRKGWWRWIARKGWEPAYTIVRKAI